MGTIAAIYSDTPGEDNSRQVTKLLKSTTRYKGGNICVVKHGFATFGYLGFNLEPKRLNRRSESCFSQDSCSILFDGLLDNKNRILDRIPINLDKNLSDAELALACYQHYGKGCANILTGEFVLIIYDSRDQKILCLRDVVGSKPVFYCHVKNKLLICSEPAQLFSQSELYPKPNEFMVVQYLLSHMQSKSETLHRGVKRLAPGHFLQATRNNLNIEQYFHPQLSDLHQHKDRNDCLNEIQRELLSSIEDRMGSSFGTTGIQLSGGIDSSSVAAGAQRMRRSQDLSKQNLEFFSLIFPGESCDESNYIKAFCELNTDVKSHQIKPKTRDHEWFSDYVRRHQDIPPYPNGCMSMELYKLAKQRRVSVLLTGLGGDEWFQASRFYIADLLARGQILELMKFMGNFRYSTNYSERLSHIFNYGLKPLIPDSIKHIIRRLRIRNPPTIPLWMGPALTELTEKESIRSRQKNKEGKNFAAEDLLFAATQGFQSHALEMEERNAAENGVELSHPLHDQRIIQLSLQLPMKLRVRNGYNKYALRHSMAEFLPQEIFQRRDKARFSPVFLNTLKTIGRQNFKPTVASKAGWVNQENALKLYDELMYQFSHNQSVNGATLWNVWCIYGLELMSREVF